MSVWPTQDATREEASSLKVLCAEFQNEVPLPTFFYADCRSCKTASVTENIELTFHMIQRFFPCLALLCFHYELIKMM